MAFKIGIEVDEDEIVSTEVQQLTDDTKIVVAAQLRMDVKA